MTAQLSRERLEEKLLEHIKHGGDSEEETMIRMLLAGMDQKPVLHRYRRVNVEPYGPYPWSYGEFVGFSTPIDGIEDEYFYAAPPAPVAVWDELDELVLKNCLNCQREHRITHYSLKDCCPHCGSYEWGIAKPLGNEQAPVPTDEQGKPYPVMAVKVELGFLENFDRIISERDGDIEIGQLGCGNYDALMLAALDAFRATMLKAVPVTAASVPDGWKLVPVEPTWEMLSADGCKEHHDGQKCLHHDNRRRIWRAMLAAAPAAPEQE